MEQRFFPAGGGSVICRQREGRVTVEAVRPDDGLGLYKLRLLGGSRGLILGVLLPEESALRLRRTIPVERLTAEGCWPVTGAEIILTVPFEDIEPPPGWIREEDPARLFKGDALLKRSAEGLGHVFLRPGKGNFWFAVPYGEGTAFALTPLFCLARVEKLGGKDYVIYLFREDGVPLLPR